MIFSALPPEMKARPQEQFEQRQARWNTPSQRQNQDFDLSM
ncbi:hypothetical protein NMYAN_20277 [Nitrosomonas nitrosa]|uniref:Uncharacterized protein n=1 Tax=Nitrosomonas nitrosa TaxID=52442 RepID=A0A8H9D8W1_9PROT|nr:hypothetical protein NMYAN_20277 [Nitrosomonas nitrosa]